MYTACNMIEQIGIFPKRVSISNCVFFSKYQTVLPRIHFFFFFLHIFAKISITFICYNPKIILDRLFSKNR